MFPHSGVKFQEALVLLILQASGHVGSNWGSSPQAAVWNLEGDPRTRSPDVALPKLFQGLLWASLATLQGEPHDWKYSKIIGELLFPIAVREELELQTLPPSPILPFPLFHFQAPPGTPWAIFTWRYQNLA